MPLSALFGGVAGGPCIEYLGRRNTILGTALPFMAGTVAVLDRFKRDAKRCELLQKHTRTNHVSV